MPPTNPRPTQPVRPPAPGKAPAGAAVVNPAGPVFINTGERAVKVFNEKKRDVWVWPQSDKVNSPDPAKTFEVRGDHYAKFAGEGQPLTLFRPPVAPAAAVAAVATKPSAGGGKQPVAQDATAAVRAAAPVQQAGAGVVEPAADASGADSAAAPGSAGAGGGGAPAATPSGGKSTKLS